MATPKSVAYGTTTATIPAHDIGDLIIIAAFRDGSSTSPTLGSGFTSMATNLLNTAGARVGYRYATVTNTASGTWTNATDLIAMVFDKDELLADALGAFSKATGTASSLTWPALTLEATDGSSTILSIAMHRSTNTTVDTPPTGYTNVATRLSATSELAASVLEGATTSPSSSTQAVGGTASGWWTFRLELRGIPALVPAETVKMYLTNEAATHTPGLNVGGWEGGSTSVQALLTYPSGSVAVTGNAASSTAANWDVRLRRFISEPILVAGRIGGDAKWNIRVRSSSVDLHAVTYFSMWVTVGNTDAVRETPIIGTGSVEWQTADSTYESMQMSTTFPLGNIVDAQVGDRVVFEVGYRANATLTGEIGYLARGGIGGTDAVAGDTANGNPTWLSFQTDTPGMFPTAKTHYVSAASAYAVTSAATFYYNDYYSAGGTSIKWGATTYSSLASWRAAASGQEFLSSAPVGYEFDPKVTAATTAPTAVSWTDRVAGSKVLASDSPVYGAGLDILTAFAVNPGLYDFFGHTLAAPFSVGADDSTATSSVNTTNFFAFF